MDKRRHCRTSVRPELGDRTRKSLRWLSRLGAELSVLLLLSGCATQIGGVPAANRFDEIPAPENPQQTVDFIRSDGRDLISIHQSAMELAGSELSTDRCEKTIRALERLGTFEEVSILAARVPDTVLRNYSEREIRDLNVAVSLCAASQTADFEKALVDVNESTGRTELRLREIGYH